MRRHRYDPERIRHRKADDRYHRRHKGSVLKKLKFEIRQGRKKGEGK